MNWIKIEEEISKGKDFRIEIGSFQSTLVYCNRCNTMIGSTDCLTKLKCPRCDREDLNLD